MPCNQMARANKKIQRTFEHSTSVFNGVVTNYRAITGMPPPASKFSPVANKELNRRSLSGIEPEISVPFKSIFDHLDPKESSISCLLEASKKIMQGVYNQMEPT